MSFHLGGATGLRSSKTSITGADLPFTITPFTAFALLPFPLPLAARNSYAMDPSAAPQDQSIIIATARRAYALLGFSLSVLTAFFSLFWKSSQEGEHAPLFSPTIPSKPSPQRLSTRRRTDRSASDHSVKFAPLPPSPRIFHEKQASSHQDFLTEREPSLISIPEIPIIQIQESTPVDVLRTGIHFDEPIDINDSPSAARPFTTRSASTSTTTSVSTTSSESTSTFSPDSSSGSLPIEHEKPHFKLFKGWGKDGKDRPKIERQKSTPMICQGPLGPLLPGICPRPPKNVEVDEHGVVIDKKKKKSLKHSKSAQNLSCSDEKLFRKKSKSEKKKPEILRTRPYEAPYFAEIPAPHITRQRSFIVDASAASDSSAD